MEPQRHGDTAHHGPVARRALRGFGERPAPGLERLDAPLDELQGAARGHTDTAAVGLHPPHPALCRVRRVEIAALGEGLAKEQGHRRVVVVGRAFGRRRRIPDAARIRRADRSWSAQVLGGDPQLIAGHEPQQRSAGAGDQFGVEHRPLS